MSLVEQIESANRVVAILVRAGFSQEGVHFFTPDEFSQQLAFIRHPAGKVIDPHIHNEVSRQVFLTNEVLFIKSGRVRVDLYDESRDYLESRILLPGDVILLVQGGHGFEVLEAAEMIEVKQGPYVGEADKTRFASERSAIRCNHEP